MECQWRQLYLFSILEVKPFLKFFFTFAIVIALLASPMIGCYLLGDFYVSRPNNNEAFIIGKVGESASMKYRYESFTNKQEWDVVVIGSSRVLQIRKQFFKGSFINMGLSLNSTKSLIEFADDMQKKGISITHLILNFDPWWFQELNTELDNKKFNIFRKEVFPGILQSYKTIPYFKFKSNSECGGFKLMGIQARRKYFGFRNDGSNCNGSDYYINRKVNVFSDNPSESDISAKYFVGGKVSRIYLLQYQMALKKLKKVSKNVVVINLPLPSYFYKSSFYNSLENNIQRINEKLGVDTYSFKPASNKFFIDNLHITSKYSYLLLKKIPQIEQKMRPIEFIDENFIKGVDDVLFQKVRTCKN